jgi:hypothetical protein
MKDQKMNRKIVRGDIVTFKKGPNEGKIFHLTHIGVDDVLLNSIPKKKVIYCNIDDVILWGDYLQAKYFSSED